MRRFISVLIEYRSNFPVWLTLLGATLLTPPLFCQRAVIVGVRQYRQSAPTVSLQFANKDVVATSAGDDTRVSVGLSYWWAGHNANVKGAYTRLDTTGLAKRNEWTIQLQLFYF